MKQLEQKYYNLQPKWSYISDEYILGLAWKKSDGFIRSHNWYAELLSLDNVTFSIDNKVNYWSNKIKSHEFSNNALNLIPAPKSAKWFIEKAKRSQNPKWIQNKDDRKLRPLANISIKDQTIATAITMCLADALETRQKNCSLIDQDYTDHIANRVVSYGNRLLCDWDKGVARFRWGGSEFYRKYSSDYRAFLQRPISIGRETQRKVSTADEVYIVNIDLKNFFGSIKIDLLFDQLERIASKHHEEEHKSNYVHDSMFWIRAKNVFSWDWSSDSQKIANSLDLPTLIGLPQGLASSGALSNAYLIGFDEKVIEKIGSTISDSRVNLHDYCRYVDDLRFVVSGESLDKDDIKSSVEKFVQELLDDDLHQNSDDTIAEQQVLKVNDDKTQVFELADLDNWSSLTNRVNELQDDIGPSGVPDRDTLESSIPALQQLLQIESDDVLLDFEKEFSGLSVGNAIKIESIRKFSANRLSSTFIEKRKILSEAERFQQGNESRVIAKKLLSTWLKDPSVMVLLRKAIEINPSVSLYEKVLEQVISRVLKNGILKDRYIMIYILSDIFRSSADLYRKLEDSRLGDYLPFINLIASTAQKVLSSKAKLPDYIYYQALFYLLIVKQPFFDTKKATPNIERLHKVLMKQRLVDLNEDDGYLFELASQINNDYQSNAAFLLSHTGQSQVVDGIIKNYAFHGGRFWLVLWEEMSRINANGYIEKYRWAIPTLNKEMTPSGTSHFLSSIASFDDNPFKYEHSLLKLGIELVRKISEGEPGVWLNRSPHEIKVNLHNSRSWSDTWKSHTEIRCELEPKGQDYFDPRYKTPEWLTSSSDYVESTENDEQRIYWICSLLRGAALGNVDYTQRNDLKWDELKYSGIRTQWLKRRMGMLHSPESIVGSFGTISDWFAHLLQHGLQWPGFSSSYIEEEEILSIKNLDDFASCLKKRLETLESYVCQSSDVPSLPTVIKRPELKQDLFRVVTVQQLFPKDKDFHLSDVTLDHPNIRWKHREHLAEICKLTEQTLSAKLRTGSREYKSTADLIVFSEVAVHPEDEDIIRGLALKTKSIVFAGFVFTEHDGRIVNKARWIIPDKAEFGMQWRIRDQGKHHMTDGESSLGVMSYRPCQHIIEILGSPEGPFKITGAICYDATDIQLAADLRDKTDMFVIAAHNKDVNTFDNMASALQWHMFQHIVIANTGEYGGSTMQAPYKENYHKLISHAHGANQIAISTADIDLAAFRRKVKEYKKTKAQPAGFARKH
ncbi:reverse transcriptase domain-containing protein [Vibrio harveyi]